MEKLLDYKTVKTANGIIIKLINTFLLIQFETANVRWFFLKNNETAQIRFLY